MINEDFSPKQQERLSELIVILAKQFTEILDQRFSEERAYNDMKRAEDREYLTQLFRQELATLRRDLMKLDARENNDAKESVEQWDTFNQRLTELEAAFKKFTAAV